MKKTSFFAIWLFAIVFGAGLPFPLLQAESMTARLRGRILIQVEQHGEAWYVFPLTDKRYYLGRPSDAFAVMRQLGLGISEADFTNLSASGKKRLAGRILIRVQKSGQAYYVNPTDLSLHYLGRPSDAFAVMRQLGLGINDLELSKLPVEFLAQQKIDQPGTSTSTPQNPSTLLGQMERDIHKLINAEREKNGLQPLSWNDQVAAVAREHSQDQADENQRLIGTIRLCSYPFIHHEGQKFGLFHSDRLSQRSVHYLSASAENIALIPHIKDGTYESTGIQEQDCQGELTQANSTYDRQVHQASSTDDKIAILRAEILRRENLLEASPIINILNTSYYGTAEVNQRAVSGWMNSPGHRRNILNGAYDEAGIGVAQVKDYFIITQVFIKRAACGYRDGACCKDERFYYCYQPNSCNSSNICTEALAD